MTKITNLTEEQRGRFKEFVDKWIAIGLSTEPANRVEAEKGINLSYKAGGLSEPQEIIWCQSPNDILQTAAVLEHEDKLDSRIVKAFLKNKSPQVFKDIMDSLEINTDTYLKKLYSGFCYGQHDANFLAYYNYHEEVCGLVEETKKLEGLSLQAGNAGWFLPFENVCFVSERPNSINRDESCRLHNLTGPALTYPDGWSLYLIHGTKVPEWFIKTPEKITYKTIADENNLELRRIMLDIYGWEEYFKERIKNKEVELVDTKVVWKEQVKLYKDFDGEVERHFLHVINGTTEADGTKHEFIINCKNFNDDAEESVHNTYPELMERLKDVPEDIRMEILRTSLRT